MFMDTCLEQVAKNDEYQIIENMTLGELRWWRTSAKARIAPNFPHLSQLAHTLIRFASCHYLPDWGFSNSLLSRRRSEEIDLLFAFALLFPLSEVCLASSEKCRVSGYIGSKLSKFWHYKVPNKRTCTILNF